MHKKKLLIAGTILAICLLGLAVYVGVSMFAKNSTTKDNKPAKSTAIVVASVCDEQMIIDASAVIANNDLGLFSTQTAKIMKLDNHQNDPNCEYILSRYYLAIGETDNAAKSIDQLQRVLSAGGVYSTSFNPPAVNVNDLRMILISQREKQDSKPTVDDGKELNDVDKMYEKTQ